MKYLYTFLVCYFVAFVWAWIWAGKRLDHAAKVMKNQGMPDSMIDEHYKNMSGATWLMSIQTMLVTGTILGIIVSIIIAIAT
jgi:hypothetical protein